MWSLLPRLATIFGTAWAGAYMAKSDDYDTNNGITNWYNSLPLIMRLSLWLVLAGTVMALVNYKRKGKFSLR
jgi:hypothetical protein